MVLHCSLISFWGSGQQVTIGTQVWSTRNLTVSYFRNGDPIPEAKTDEDWKRSGADGQPAWCYYNNDTAMGSQYCNLYNWFAIHDPRGLAPTGWHIPTDDEWNTLTHYMGDYLTAGKKMKSMNGWKENGNGTNESGFSGLPGGFRFLFGTFGGIGEFGMWWSATKYNKNTAGSVLLYNSFDFVNATYTYKEEGLSVRCLKD